MNESTMSTDKKKVAESLVEAIAKQDAIGAVKIWSLCEKDISESYNKLDLEPEKLAEIEWLISMCRVTTTTIIRAWDKRNNE